MKNFTKLADAYENKVNYPISGLHTPEDKFSKMTKEQKRQLIRKFIPRNDGK